VISGGTDLVGVPNVMRSTDTVKGPPKSVMTPCCIGKKVRAQQASTR